MPILHNMPESGNSYKVRLVARQVGFDCTLKNYPFGSGLTKTPEFLAKNPEGRVPMLEFEDGGCLTESNAIMWYIAEETPLVPALGWDRAQCLSWMFFEQYSHEPYVAVTRLILKYLKGDDRKKREPQLPELLAKGNRALAVMEAHLKKNDWFAGPRYSIADASLYAYTHEGAAGGYDMDKFPAVQRWLAQVKAQPGYIPLSESW